jgi:hypothetical protein
MAAILQLVWRVADDHIELHVVSKKVGDTRPGVIVVNERIGVSF